jgi:hypothetical protein
LPWWFFSKFHNLSSCTLSWRPKPATLLKTLGGKSISSSAQYVTLRNFFSHPSLVMYSLSTAPIKLKLGQQIGGGLLIANHMDQSLWWANQKPWAAVRSYLLHSFVQRHSAAAPRTSHGTLRNYTEPKPISWVKPVQVEFSSSNFTVQDHILSTAGDALKVRQGPTQHHPSAPNLITLSLRTTM